MTLAPKYLLGDADVARCIVTGYHLLQPDLPPGLNERIAARLDALESNPGDAVTEAVPELWQVLDHPAVRGALVSLLGPDYEVQAHHHWHCKPPGSGHMAWHQDGAKQPRPAPQPPPRPLLSHGRHPGDGPHGHRPGHRRPAGPVPEPRGWSGLTARRPA